MFENLIGNDNIKQALIESIHNKNIAHSYVFTGIRGVGKKHFAKEFAKHIMCLKEAEYNNNCDSCLKFDSGNNPDYKEIEPEGKTIKIEQIRNMQEHLLEKPIISNKKLYIIDNAETMSEEAQNCLLKTLEEPPQHAIIILITSNENKLLQTIKSRCITIKFNRIPDIELEKHLKNLTKDQIKLLNGSFENINSIEEKEQEYKEIKKIVEILKNEKMLDLLEKSEILYNNKENILDILNYLNIVLFENKMWDLIEIVEKTKNKILLNNNYEMCIDNMLVNCWKCVNNYNN